LPLRLFTVGIGAALLVVVFRAVKVVAADVPRVAVLAAGFVAFIPQHVAMTAGVNNDALAELVVAATLWASTVYVSQEHPRPWGIGVLVGIALLTKTTAYVVVGVAAAAVLVRWRRGSRSTRWALEQLALVFVPAALISAPWFIRNGMTYGWHDPLGLGQHNLIVENQPRSAEWLAAYGWDGLLWQLARTTFQSFWGQFGWMALPLPTQAYQVLLVLSGLLLIGFAVWVVQTQRSSPGGLSIEGPGSLLAFSALLTLLAFLWYNLTFVQHQGRYLYPALVPLSTAAALGLHTVTRPLPTRLRPWSQLFLLGSLAAFNVYCVWKVIYPNL
jgi:4-amino-4-deoxy-L-arabinose transferase-like glycosyltransferase